MARFCAKCGTAVDADACFCGECGVPLRPAAAAAAAPAPTAARRAGKLAFLAAGGVLAVFGVVGGLAYLTADEAASPEVFAKAIGKYYETNPAAEARLRCVADLDLEKDPVAVRGFESRRRATMDELVAAGLYAPPEVQSSGGFFSMQSYRYQRTDAGSRVIKDGKLCVAPAIEVRNVRFEQGAAGSTMAAQFQYDLKRPEPWFKGELARQLGRSLPLEKENFAVLELRDGKWVMSSDTARFARAVAAGRTAVPAQSLGQRVQSWFRTGNPLIGQWRITNSPWLAGTRLVFNANQASVGRPNEAVRYEVKRDTVTVHYVERNTSDVFQIQDDDHINLLSDAGVFLLERIKEGK